MSWCQQIPYIMTTWEISVPISDSLTLLHFGFNHEKFTPPPLHETTQKLLEGEGGGSFSFLISCPEFYRKKNLSGRKSQPPPPPVHKPCNPSKPSKVYFVLNFTQRSTPQVDVHEIIIKVCSDINGCIQDTELVQFDPGSGEKNAMTVHYD